MNKEKIKCFLVGCDNDYYKWMHFNDIPFVGAFCENHVKSGIFPEELKGFLSTPGSFKSDYENNRQEKIEWLSDNIKEECRNVGCRLSAVRAAIAANLHEDD